MKKYLGLIALSICMSFVFISCDKDDQDGGIVEITLKDSKGDVVPNYTVYEYNSDVWKLIGDEIVHCNAECVTDDDGVASFKIDSYDFFNSSETFYFSCHYKLGNESKSRNVGVTLSQGDNISKTIILN